MAQATIFSHLMRVVKSVFSKSKPPMGMHVCPFTCQPMRRTFLRSDRMGLGCIDCMTFKSSPEHLRYSLLWTTNWCFKQPTTKRPLDENNIAVLSRRSFHQEALRYVVWSTIAPRAFAAFRGRGCKVLQEDGNMPRGCVSLVWRPIEKGWRQRRYPL